MMPLKIKLGLTIVVCGLLLTFIYGYELGTRRYNELKFSKTGKLHLVADNPCSLTLPLYSMTGDFISHLTFIKGHARTNIMVTTGEKYVLFHDGSYQKSWILIEIPEVSFYDLNEEHISVELMR